MPAKKDPDPVPSRTMVIRGKVVDVIETYSCQGITHISFSAAFRYFLSLGIQAHEKQHGSIRDGKPWNAVEGMIKSERKKYEENLKTERKSKNQVDLEDWLE